MIPRGQHKTRLNDIRTLGGWKVASPPRHDSAMGVTTRRGGEWASEVEWVFRGEGFPEPELVVMRVSKDSARIEDLAGHPYSEPMPIRQACLLLREASK